MKRLMEKRSLLWKVHPHISTGVAFEHWIEASAWLPNVQEWQVVHSVRASELTHRVISDQTWTGIWGTGKSPLRSGAHVVLL